MNGRASGATASGVKVSGVKVSGTTRTAVPAEVPVSEVAALEVRGLGVRVGRAQLLSGVDLTVPAGSWTAVVGPNGAGKSTLLRAIAGLLGYQGQVLLGGRDAASLRPRQRAATLGYAPQVPTVPQAMSVAEYVTLGRTPYRSLLAGPRSDDRDVVTHALDELDLTPLADRPLRTLSGGERQRAVLARALAQQPSVLLLDEPTSALDLGHAQNVLELVDRLRWEQGLTVLSSLHDLVLAGQYAQRLVLLAGGRMVAEGGPAQVLTAQALATHYGARAEVSPGPDGVRVHPVRRPG
ncbi:MAG TPA: ABC transporter ATP-binding protein [Kineosporiaceae bacterium]|nr:ABC transporter ATP-binding protein [Kineosporiaceae bacterium]